MQKSVRKGDRYETPRLQTYGSLTDLTKGTGGSLIDTDQSLTKGA